MASTIYIRPETRSRIEKHKPPSWPLVDYLEFLSRLHSEMDQVEKAQREYDFQCWLKARREADNVL